MYEKRIGNLSVLIIQVPPSPKKPYFLKSDGFPKGVYVRIDSHTRRATQDYIEDLVREGNRLYFDEEFITQGVEILSKEKLKQFYGNTPTTKRLLADKIITPGSQASYHPTVTGVLFFTENPHLYVPEATVICSLFKGDSGREIIQMQELTGPIKELAESSFRLVKSWTSRNFQLQGVHLHRIAPPILPMNLNFQY